MDIKPIKTDADYRAALKEVESLMMAGPDTPEGEKLPSASVIERI
jgi:HTH-type transcriptional regulator / antitoxin HigA